MGARARVCVRHFLTIKFLLSKRGWRLKRFLRLCSGLGFKVSLFLLLFTGPKTLSGTIHGSHCTILASFLPLSIVFSAKNF